MKQNPFFVIPIIVTILLLSISFAYAATPKLNTDQLTTIYNESNETSGTSILQKIEGNSKGLQEMGQNIGIHIVVFFFIVGWIITVLAHGLKHPEYQKWGRGTVTYSVIAYIMIKFIPILAYSF
ncbi:hypothetical protein ACEU2D_24600 [Brevibacillus laterosporus]|uniref:hypothetical protein n=1 Tax=Brevibacillus laterosporus TaxID=1465 RepID=UPI0035A595A5